MRFDNAGSPSLRVEEVLSNWTADYMAYIHSPEWAKKRREAFAHHGRVCAKCRATKLLHVHHLTYKRLFKEDVKTDLQILCKACHMAHHAIKIVVKPPKPKKQKQQKKPKGPAITPRKRGGQRGQPTARELINSLRELIAEEKDPARRYRTPKREQAPPPPPPQKAKQDADELRAAAELLWEEEDIPTLTELDREFLAIVRGF